MKSYGLESYWPKSGQSFWDIRDPSFLVNISWSRNYYTDYKNLSRSYAACGIKVFEEIVASERENTKTDSWFLTGIFLVRQAIELGLKALVCRIAESTPAIQSIFISSKHNLSVLLDYYSRGNETYLTTNEFTWLETYIDSLEAVDAKSDMFRFPFDEDFLMQYRDKFIDVVDVANNLIQAVNLLNKCIDKGAVTPGNEFDKSLMPDFFVFANHGIGNCYLWQSFFDDGFHAKYTGCHDIAHLLFDECQDVSWKNKIYPLLFLLRNTIELCLKQILYIRVDNGVGKRIFQSKRFSHKIKKDLWKAVRPVIEYYARETNNDLSVIALVETQLYEIDSVDVSGDNFRYPTSYSMEYRIDNITVDVKNIFMYMMGIIEFLNGCTSMLSSIADYEAEMHYEMLSCCTYD